MAGLDVQAVDETGVILGASTEPAAADVLFDGRRIWSFKVPRDTVATGRHRQHAPWPEPLRHYLDGSSRLVVRDTVDATVYFDDEVAFGTSAERVAFVNRSGVALGIDKSGRMVPTFETRPAGDIAALVEAGVRVLDTLREAGVQPFVSYGTLLGAIREGTVLGHDSDADLAYISEHSVPVDVIRESFRLQREVGRLGLRTLRYSGAAFKVRVPEADGFLRGLDVFAGFFDDGRRLYLMGEVGAPFQRDWIYPLSSATLEGVEVPVPARPDKLLEAIYGPSWRVPDPVFKFEPSPRLRRALTDWFRGHRPNFKYWHAVHSKGSKYRDQGSDLAVRAAEDAVQSGATVLDIGAGRGADSRWLARQGIPVIAYDFVTVALDSVREQALEDGLPLKVRRVNLNDSRAALGEGARLARLPQRRIVLAHHLIDALGPRGVENFARLCSMALRNGGTCYAEFFVDAISDEEPWTRGRVKVSRLVRMLKAQGADSVGVERSPRKGSRPRTARLVARWSS